MMIISQRQTDPEVMQRLTPKLRHRGVIFTVEVMFLSDVRCQLGLRLALRRLKQYFGRAHPVQARVPSAQSKLTKSDVKLFYILTYFILNL